MKITPKMTYKFDFNEDISTLFSMDNFIDLTVKKENKKTKIEIYKNKHKNTLF